MPPLPHTPTAMLNYSERRFKLEGKLPIAGRGADPTASLCARSGNGGSLFVPILTHFRGIIFCC